VAADGLAQPRALQHRHARGHDPLTARLLARERLRFEHVDAQSRAPEQQRQRRARRAAARDYDIGHGHGMKRGLCANAAR